MINYRFFLQFLDCLCFCYILTVCDIYVLKSKLQRLFDVTWSHEDVLFMFLDKNILWHILLLTRSSIYGMQKEEKQAPTICDKLIYSSLCLLIMWAASLQELSLFFFLIFCFLKFIFRGVDSKIKLNLYSTGLGDAFGNPKVWKISYQN